MPKGVYKRKKRPQIDRFLEKVEKKKDGCWFWKASKHRLGYGYFSHQTGKSMLAHRWSYLHFKGDIPEGTEIDHLCRNPSCVNPDHLEAVSHQENMRRGITGLHMREKSKNITHCPAGHEYNSKNTYLHKGKYKQCRVCKLEKQKLDRSRKAAIGME